MRTASPTLLFAVALLIALVGAWGAQQHDARLQRARPTASPRCLSYLERLQSTNASSAARDSRATQLRAHLDECRADPLYVEQLVRELLELGELNEAKTIFETAAREHVFAPAESEALEAWIALGELRVAHAEDRADDASRARAQAKEIATRLAVSWPEWAVPAQLLLEVDRSTDDTSNEVIDRLGQLQRDRRRVRTGAFVRELPTVLYPLFISGLLLIAAWLPLTSVRQWLDLRARIDQPTVTISDALQNGASSLDDQTVAVNGILELRPGARELVAPFSKQSCLWFDRVLNYSNAKARSRLTSEDQFVIRDASGALTIDPVGFRVDTHHSNVTMGQSRLGYKRVKPTIEDRLHVGDSVYVRGVLTRSGSKSGAEWMLTSDKDQRVILTNIDRTRLQSVSIRWLTIGVGISGLAIAVLLWSVKQRTIPNVPGVLT